MALVELPLELTRRAFRVANGEFGWSREDARTVVAILAGAQCAVLGGELWWVPAGAKQWTGLIPQQHGPAAVYPWETERVADESWVDFVERCARESIQAIERWPAVDDMPADLDGRILYNLTWVSEPEYRELGGSAV
jgi:hypothetical protein